MGQFPCSSLPAKVYLYGDGTIYFGIGASFEFGSPSDFTEKYNVRVLYKKSDNTVLIQKKGIKIYEGSIDSIVDENGVQVSPNSDIDILHSYFVGLGFDSGGSGGGITPEQVQDQINISIAPLIADIASLKQRVNILEQNAGYIQLDAPVPSVAGTTSSGTTVSWPAILHATSYDVTVNGVTTNTTNTSLPVSGLTASTAYTAIVVAKGTLPYTDSDAGSVGFTTQAGGGGGSNLANPWNDTLTWNDNLIWNDAA